MSRETKTITGVLCRLQIGEHRVTIDTGGGDFWAVESGEVSIELLMELSGKTVEAELVFVGWWRLKSIRLADSGRGLPQ